MQGCAWDAPNITGNGGLQPRFGKSGQQLQHSADQQTVPGLLLICDSVYCGRKQEEMVEEALRPSLNAGHPAQHQV